MKQTSEEMIRELAADLSPVVPLGRLRDTVLTGLLFGFPFFVYWVFDNGIRQQFRQGELPDGIYLLVVCVSLLLATGGLLAGLAAAVPGREEAYRLGRNVFLAGLVLGTSALGYQVVFGGTSLLQAAASSVGCTTRAMMLGVPVAIVAARFITRGLAFRPLLALALGCSGGVGFAAALVHLTCSHPDPAHLLLGHGLAPISGGLVILLALSIGLGASARLRRS